MSNIYINVETGKSRTIDEVEAIETAASVRKERDALLTETDWWANSDVRMTDKQRAYRQALRDVTKQEGFPIDITWPTKPE